MRKWLRLVLKKWKYSKMFYCVFYFIVNHFHLNNTRNFFCVKGKEWDWWWLSENRTLAFEEKGDKFIRPPTKHHIIVDKIDLSLMTFRLLPLVSLSRTPFDETHNDRKRWSLIFNDFLLTKGYLSIKDGKRFSSCRP